MTALDFRIGHGFDVHAYTSGSSIRLGGVNIPHTQAIKAHSDGDVLLHALCDALLGALALGDIGHHFPDTDPTWKGADSQCLLGQVVAMVHEKGWLINNCDVTIIAERPKMAPHLTDMVVNISAALAVTPSQVNVKATTTEKLGYIGRGEGIAVHAVALLIHGKNSA